MTVMYIVGRLVTEIVPTKIIFLNPSSWYENEAASFSTSSQFSFSGLTLETVLLLCQFVASLELSTDSCSVLYARKSVVRLSYELEMFMS